MRLRCPPGPLSSPTHPGPPVTTLMRAHAAMLRSPPQSTTGRVYCAYTPLAHLSVCMLPTATAQAGPCANQGGCAFEPVSGRSTQRSAPLMQTRSRTSGSSHVALTSFDHDNRRAVFSRQSSPVKPLDVEEERVASLQQMNTWRASEFARLQDEVLVVTAERDRLRAERDELAAVRDAVLAHAAAENGGALRRALDSTLGLLSFLLVCDRHLAESLLDRMPRRAWLFAVFGCMILFGTTVRLKLLIGFAEAIVAQLGWPCALCPRCGARTPVDFGNISDSLSRALSSLLLLFLCPVIAA